MLRLDMIAVLVPATWTVPGAGPIPTTSNKGFAEGRLEPVSAEVGELITAGMNLPGSLFEAEGTNRAGARLGVAVGVYDTGGGDVISLVQQSVADLKPSPLVNPTRVLSKEGLRTLQRWDDNAAEGGSLVCDYWARFGKTPTNFVMLRFWRTGPASVDDEDIFDDVVGSLLAAGGPMFSGAAGLAMGRKLLPPEPMEVVAPGRFRYAGWRLGRVFHSKMIGAKDAELATEMGARPRDALLLLLVLLPWIAATLAFVGVGPILLLGGMTALGALKQLRSRGLTAVGMLLVVLGVLLAFGVATS